MASKTSKWRVHGPDDDGVVTVVCKQNKRLICWLHLDDYENKKDALTVAKAIANMARLMPSKLLVRTNETIKRINRYGRNSNRSES